MLANLFLPLGGWLPVVPLLLGWWAFFRGGRPRRLASGTSIALSSLAIAAATIAASAPVSWYDTGLYYAQAVRWTLEAPAPFGLANLHGRLAFNSSWHVLAAALDLPPGGDFSGLLAINGLLWIAYGGLLYRALSGLGRWREVPFSTTFLTLSSVPWLSLARPDTLASGSPDAAVVLLALFGGYAVARAVEAPSVQADWILIALGTGIFATTVKLSAAPLALVPVSLLLAMGLGSLAPGIRSRAPGAAALFLIVVSGTLVLLGSWVVRGVVLSGCPVYPLPIGCLESFDWTVPWAQLDRERLGVLAFGRQAGGFSGDALQGWGWLPSWLAAASSSVRVRLAAAIAVAGALAWLAGGRAPLQPRARRTYLLTLIGPVFGLVAWFATAPNLRFVEGYIWVLSLGILAAGLDHLRLARRGRLSDTDTLHVVRGFRVGHLALAMVSAVLVLLMFRALLVSPRAGWLVVVPVLPDPALRAERLSSGVDVYVPISGDQCWGAPLPCTPYFDPGMNARPGPSGSPPRWFAAAVTGR